MLPVTITNRVPRINMNDFEAEFQILNQYVNNAQEVVRAKNENWKAVLIIAISGISAVGAVFYSAYRDEYISIASICIFPLAAYFTKKSIQKINTGNYFTKLEAAQIHVCTGAKLILDCLEEDSFKKQGRNRIENRLIEISKLFQLGIERNVKPNSPLSLSHSWRNQDLRKLFLEQADEFFNSLTDMTKNCFRQLHDIENCNNAQKYPGQINELNNELIQIKKIIMKCAGSFNQLMDNTRRAT